MKVHFIAVGGSAMHNLALALQSKGYEISGSDDEIFEPALSRLSAAGLLPEQLGWFPEKITPELDAVILGMHARADNPELLRAQQLGVKIYSFPEYLYHQSLDKKRVVIAGSHGKTTITSMILHVLRQAAVEVDFMVGAIIPGFDVMVKLTENAQWMVLEGDEYLSSAIDRVPKFWHYHPHIAVLSGIGWDHVNVFQTYEKYLEQFRVFVRNIPPEGLLIYNQSDDEVCKLASEALCRTMPYTLPQWGRNGTDVMVYDNEGQAWPLQIFGLHNLSNLMAAKAICLEMGVGEHVFFRALSDFKGAALRLECVYRSDELTIYRDFAHAPSKLKATIEALRLQYPDRHLVVCFELHTYSSLSPSFMTHYAGCMNPADAVAVFYDPHAVALKRLELVSEQYIREAFDLPDAAVLADAASLIRWLQSAYRPGCVIGLMSSGNFNGINVRDLAIHLSQ